MAFNDIPNKVVGDQLNDAEFNAVIAEIKKKVAQLDFDSLNNSFVINQNGEFYIVDSNTAIGLSLIGGVLKTVTGDFKSVVIADNQELKKGSDHIIFAVSDDDLTAYAFAFTKEGELIIKKVTAHDIETKTLKITDSVTLPFDFKRKVLDRLPFVFGPAADYLLIMSYGQSNSVGGGASGFSSFPRKYDPLMPVGGPRPFTTTNFSAFTDYSDGAVGTSLPLLGVFNKFTELIADENFMGPTTKGFRVIGTAPGEGSKSAAELQKGTVYFDRMIDNVVKCHEIALQEGKSFNVPFVGWTQGENDVDLDTTYAAYKATTEQIIADASADILAVTNQRNNIPFISYQVAKYSSTRPDYDRISKTHYDLGISNPLFVCACPSYQWDYVVEGYDPGVSDGYIVHFTPDTRIIYGHYIAIAAKRSIVDGKKFLPLHPIKFKVSGNNVLITYHVPFGHLEFDTTIVSDPGNFGFRVLDSVGAELSLSNIKIVGDNSVSIDCSASPAGGKFIYARDPSQAYILNYDTMIGHWGARGCLRDNQGDYMTIPDLSSYPLHNWALASYLDI